MRRDRRTNWGGSLLQQYGMQMGLLSERQHREAALMEAKRRAEENAREAQEVSEALKLEMEQRLKAMDDLEHLANHDVLTGLPNRHLFNIHLAKMVSIHRRTGNNVAVMFIDLDRFKDVNDTLGHDVGDELLKTVAQRLTGDVRDEDVVARLGGDEFAIVQVGLNYPVDAHRQAERILETMAQPIEIGPNRLFSGASIGITVFPDDGNDPAELQKNADLAMYQAKEDSRNTFRFFDDNLNAAVGRRRLLEDEMRIALEEENFEVYYQPKIGLQDDTIVGAEALARWNHPQEGSISPVEFIPVAERTGLINVLGEWILKKVCEQIKDWTDRGLPDVKIAVNLSSIQFRDRDIPKIVSEILNETGIDPKRLELEITESAIMTDIRDGVNVLGKLNDLGVSLSIDDFGTGYSSLSYLRSLPVDKIKVDRSFVMEVETSDTAAAIARAIVVLGISLDLEIVAEGIENKEQLAVLRDLNCHEGQGFLFGTALEKQDFEEFMQNWQGIS